MNSLPAPTGWCGGALANRARERLQQGAVRMQRFVVPAGTIFSA
jgi:hypothetical protein